MKRPWSVNINIRDIWPQNSTEPLVLINALSLAPGGSFVVLKNYILSFVKQRPQWRFILLQDTLDSQFDYGDTGPNVCILYCSENRLSYLGRYAWERKWLGPTCRQLGCDIYFGPNGVYHAKVSIPQCLLI